RYADESHVDNRPHPRCCHDDALPLFPDPAPSLSHDPAVKACSDWTTQRHQSDEQAEEEPTCREEAEQSGTSSSRARTSWTSLLPPALLSVLLALLAAFIWLLLEPPCHRSNGMRRSFHLMLRYVNGPPPT
ncbi:nesprin-2-like, partial [Stegastes partitus]|uniref:Nesprin-2-like n=1 Tax=Stegastes partitus TaxID=144197 RepID=A0A9Y4NMK9_9TELE